MGFVENKGINGEQEYSNDKHLKFLEKIVNNIKNKSNDSSNKSSFKITPF